jgi:hypothetical protein
MTTGSDGGSTDRPKSVTKLSRTGWIIVIAVAIAFGGVFGVLMAVANSASN